MLKEKKYRKHLQSKLYIILKKNQIKTGPEIERAIGNAIRHGKLPLTCEISSDNDNFLINLKDSGKGFNYRLTVHQFYHGKKYYHNHGSGMKKYSENRYVKVNWADNGSRIFLLYKK